MEAMKYYTFFRENNNFDDIQSDSIIKKHVNFEIQWHQYYMIGIDDDSKYISILSLKYSEDMVNSLTKDYSPVAGVDYFVKTN